MSVCGAEPPAEPEFCCVRTPWWDLVDEEARAADEACVELAQGVVFTAELPAVVEQAVQGHRQVNEAELAFALQREYRSHPAQLSDGLRQRVKQGMQMPVVDDLTAKDRITDVVCAFDETHAYSAHCP